MIKGINVSDKTQYNSMPNLNKNIRLILLAVLLGLALFLSVNTPPYNSLNNNQLQVLLKNNVPIYDIRRPEEWRQTGVIEGSQLLTFVDTGGRVQPGFLEQFTNAIGKNDPVILICRTGNRTGKLARLLMEELGYTNVFNVGDGITQWIRENRPVKNIMTHTSETHYSRGML